MDSLLTLTLLLSLFSLAASAPNDEADHWEAVSVEGAKATVLSRHRRESIKDETKDSIVHADREAFVLAHNSARSIVSPGASNMPFMVWNSTLERLAQGWALECKFEHGQIEKASHPIGQNLWAGNGGYNPSGAVNAWDKEKADYSYADIKCNEGAVCGHYTQVAWAKSTDVGCGIAYCDSMEGLKAGGYIIVCNYYKAGNFKGKFPYESGTACSDCPSGYTTCENNLCRKEPKCGELTCEGDGVMNPATCLCDCGGEEMGPFCAGVPGLGVAPALAPYLLGAVMLRFFM